MARAQLSPGHDCSHCQTFQFTLKSPRPAASAKGRQPKTISCRSSSRVSRFTLPYSPASSVCTAILFLHDHGYQYPPVPGAPEPEDAPDPMPEVPPVAPEPGCPGIPPVPPACPAAPDPGTLEAPPAGPFLPGLALPDRRGGRCPCSGCGVDVLPWPFIPGC